MINLKIFRFVLAVLLITTTASELHSQIIDTVCIVRKDALKRLEQAQESVLLAEKVKLLGDHIALLNSRIIELEQVVKAYESIEEYKDSLINSYQSEIALMKDQRHIFETALNDAKKEIKRYKRKLFFRTAGGIMITGAFAYLYFTK